MTIGDKIVAALRSQSLSCRELSDRLNITMDAVRAEIRRLRKKEAVILNVGSKTGPKGHLGKFTMTKEPYRRHVALRSRDLTDPIIADLPLPPLGWEPA